jgi:biotin carboxyl carrier protein
MSENKFDHLENFSVGGMLYKTHLTDKFKNRPRYVEYDPHLIKAFIPGTIVKVFVRKGTHVEEGQELLLLEAMKMRNVVAAPVSGRVKRMWVKENELVSKNQLMIELE